MRLAPSDTLLSCPGSEDDFEELAGFIAFEANHANSRERRRRWDDLLSILEAALPRG
jgi:hypothetical protein